MMQAVACARRVTLCDPAVCIHMHPTVEHTCVSDSPAGGRRQRAMLQHVVTNQATASSAAALPDLLITAKPSYGHCNRISGVPSKSEREALWAWRKAQAGDSRAAGGGFDGVRLP